MLVFSLFKGPHRTLPSAYLTSSPQPNTQCSASPFRQRQLALEDDRVSSAVVCDSFRDPGILHITLHNHLRTPKSAGSTANLQGASFACGSYTKRPERSWHAPLPLSLTGKVFCFLAFLLCFCACVGVGGGGGRGDFSLCSEQKKVGSKSKNFLLTVGPFTYSPAGRGLAGKVMGFPPKR